MLDRCSKEPVWSGNLCAYCTTRCNFFYVKPESTKRVEVVSLRNYMHETLAATIKASEHCPSEKIYNSLTYKCLALSLFTRVNTISHTSVA